MNYADAFAHLLLWFTDGHLRSDVYPRKYLTPWRNSFFVGHRASRGWLGDIEFCAQEDVPTMQKAREVQGPQMHELRV